MAWTVDDAVSHKMLRDAKIFVREVSFRLADLKSMIRIRLFRYPGDKEIYYELSHFLQPPDQTSPIVPHLKSDNNELKPTAYARHTFYRFANPAPRYGGLIPPIYF